MVTKLSHADWLKYARFLPVLAAAFLMFKCTGERSAETVSGSSPEIKVHWHARWDAERAQNWQSSHGWLMGVNFMPSTAINQLEMFQAETYDSATIDRELGFAESLGFNTIRVFLHHLLWQQDSLAFVRRLDNFLDIAEKHRINVMFVLFDGVWDPFPALGPQREPKPFVHNSGWVQSPGAEILKDTLRYKELEPYVKGIISHFRQDNRVSVWDLFNEPDNPNIPAYEHVELPNKAERSLMLLKKAFLWAREVNPDQPLTAGIWRGDWTETSKLSELDQFILNSSDVISFHNYDGPNVMELKIKQLQVFGRPLLCTEYMARGNNSTFEDILPLLKKYQVGGYSWGLVNGKTQTIYPWDSWTQPYDKEPELWFHDIFRRDGTPYSKTEVAHIRALTLPDAH